MIYLNEAQKVLEILYPVSHRVLYLKSVKNLKLAKQKSPSREQLITFG
jgi:hypothetical protein